MKGEITKMEQAIKRIEWIDIAKGITIFLVIIGHVSNNTTINYFIYSFHMPLFFIISGFLYKKKENYTKRKFKSILIPYFIFSILSFMYWFIIERNFREQNISAFKAFINIFLAFAENNGYIFNVVLWFLPCLFFTEIIFNLLITKVNYKYMKYIMFTSSIIGFIIPRITSIRLPFCIDIVFTSIVFYYIGFLLKNKLNNINKKLPQNRFYYIMIVILIIITVAILSAIEQGANMMNLKYNNYILFYLTALLGFFMVYMISNKLNIGTLKWIGKNSLYIMAIHDPLKRIVITIYAKIISKNAEQIRYEFIHILIISILVLLFSCIAILIIYKLNGKLKEYLEKNNIAIFNKISNREPKIK